MNLIFIQFILYNFQYIEMNNINNKLYLNKYKNKTIYLNNSNKKIFNKQYDKNILNNFEFHIF